METKPTFRIITRRLQETTANSFLLWEEDDLFPALGYPVKINFTGIFIQSILGSNITPPPCIQRLDPHRPLSSNRTRSEETITGFFFHHPHAYQIKGC